ncbi:MAG: hypothetical protein EA427_06570 [Spirochaetaceae bacterium]|nr:MAG: hypothetical protein EA427_06570 [Spirochaetaceae bacterium]
MRIDAIFRLIVAVFFASLPLLLAIKRGQQQRRRASAEDTPRQEPAPARRLRERRRPLTGLVRRIRADMKSVRTSMMRGDEDLREIPVKSPLPDRPATPRRRPASQAGGASAAPSGKVRVSAFKTEPERPGTGKSRKDPAEQVFGRIERRPLLQRAFLYREILDAPKGLRPPFPGLYQEEQ